MLITKYEMLTAKFLFQNANCELINAKCELLNSICQCLLPSNYVYNQENKLLALTLSPPSTTIVPYANGLDPDETAIQAV